MRTLPTPSCWRANSISSHRKRDEDFLSCTTERERYDFQPRPNALVAFAEAHAMQVNGHVLVWHQQLPDWLTQGQFSQTN